RDLHLVSEEEVVVGQERCHARRGHLIASFDVEPVGGFAGRDGRASVVRERACCGESFVCFGGWRFGYGAPEGGAGFLVRAPFERGCTFLQGSHESSSIRSVVSAIV